jgi:hypothetical protein
MVYGLDILFDAAVGGSKAREIYKTEEDLASLKDCRSALLSSWGGMLQRRRSAGAMSSARHSRLIFERS